jgi:dolichyl-phosphate-mannose--protein O-mannosyl transferase
MLWSEEGWKRCYQELNRLQVSVAASSYVSSLLSPCELVKKKKDLWGWFFASTSIQTNKDGVDRRTTRLVQSAW